MQTTCSNIDKVNLVIIIPSFQPLKVFAFASSYIFSGVILFSYESIANYTVNTHT